VIAPPFVFCPIHGLNLLSEANSNLTEERNSDKSGSEHTETAAVDSTATETETEDRRCSDICGATNNRGGRCELPAGWGTPGSGGRYCRSHGGCSIGPDDTSHLEDTDYPEDNPSGRPPENNDNAAIHGRFSEWTSASEQSQEDQDARERLEMLVSAYRRNRQRNRHRR
jgi:hypothetical protein